MVNGGDLCLFNNALPDRNVVLAQIRPTSGRMNARLFIQFLKLRNNLSLTECALRRRHGTRLSPKSVAITKNVRALAKIEEFA